MCFSNIVVILPSENWLITMSNKLKNSKYCILPFDTFKNIRELGLSKYPTRKCNNRYLFKPKNEYKKPNTNRSN